MIVTGTADAASRVTVEISGAGQVRVTPGQGTSTCTAPLTTPTGVVTRCVLSTSGEEVIVGGRVVLQARVWADTLGAANGWRFDGWTAPTGTPCSGAETTCRLLVVGSCGIGSCSYTDHSIRATFVDSQPPNTVITSKPTVVWVDDLGRATFGFDSGTPADPVASFECGLQQGEGAPPSWAPCTSPKTYSGLLDGPYTFWVRARDPSGNIDATPERWFWLEITRPDTRITSGPPDGGLVADRAATFVFDSPKAGSTFECQLDGGAWSPCTAPVRHDGLSEGPHRFAVRAVSLGYADATPAARSWTVDVTPPDTQLADAPREGLLTNHRSATFALASEPGVRFECSLDGAPFASCSPSVTVDDLGLGAHTFAARAIDGADNTDPTPVVRNWSITADLDNDGYIIPADCNDADAAIHPGARDAPRDGVDQDCARGDARFRPLDVRVRVAVGFLPGATRITSLVVERVPARARIRITCRAGRGSCPFRQRTVKVRRKMARVSLTRLFPRTDLRQGTIVEVRITKRGRLGSATRLTMRNRTLPRRTEFCLDPRNGKRAAC